MTVRDQNESADFHRWAKDAGNKLRAYVLSYASGATAVFFLALTGRNAGPFSSIDKWLLVIALLLYVSTALLCLIELHIDARRFFYVAKQLEIPEPERDWSKNDARKITRIRLIYTSYLTVFLATLAVLLFLIRQIA